MASALAEATRISTRSTFCHSEQSLCQRQSAFAARGNPEVKNIILDKPQIELIRNSAGVWNFSSLGNERQRRRRKKFSLNELNINDGQVGYTDQLNKDPAQRLRPHRFEALRFCAEKAIWRKSGRAFSGQGTEMLEFAGKVGPLNVATENALPPMSGHVSIKQVSLRG